MQPFFLVYWCISIIKIDYKSTVYREEMVMMMKKHKQNKTGVKKQQQQQQLAPLIREKTKVNSETNNRKKGFSISFLQNKHHHR